MRDTRDEVDAHLGRDRHIALAVGRRVDERGATRPILIGRVDVEDLRHDVLGACAVEQAGGDSGARIGLRIVGEGKDVGRVEERR